MTGQTRSWPRRQHVERSRDAERSREAVRAREMERAAAESAERYRSLFAFNPHATFSLDLEGHFVDANPAGQQLSGYSFEELYGMPFADLVDEADLEPVGLAFLDVLSLRPRQLDARLRHRDGTRIDLWVTAVPIVVAGEVVGVHGIAEDVTEPRRLREELETARRAAEAARVTAEEASATKSLFLANMSHEVRTPLTSVLAANEMLEDLELDDPAGHLVRTIDRSGRRLLRLVNDLLDFSQLEQSTLELVDEPFDLRRTVAEVAAGVDGLPEAEGLGFSWAVAEDTGARWRGDAFRISQVLANLLHNAVKFTGAGGVQLEAREVPGGVRFDVHDTGVGIAADVAAQLFEPFTQADASTTRPHGGAGLGLAICRELTDLMGGSLTVRSEVGVGSTFTLEVPLTPA